MHLDKVSKDDGKDDVVLRRFDEASTDIRLQIEGVRTMINGSKPYPYEIIYNRPLRRLNVLRWLGVLGDRITTPSTAVNVNIPTVVHVNQYVTALTFELFNTSTGVTHTTTTQSIQLISPAENNTTDVYLVRPVAASGVNGDYTSLKITSHQTGSLSVTDFSTTFPDETVKGTSFDFIIDVTFASDLQDTSAVRISIVNTNNVEMDVYNDIVIGSDITASVGSSNDVGWFDFVIMDDTGYESSLQRVDFACVENTPPDVNNLIHDLPSEALSTDVVTFSWSGATDLEGNDLFMVISSVQGGMISNMIGIPPNTPTYLFLNTNQTGRCIIRWRIFDGANYSIEQLFIMKVDSKDPIVDDVTLTIEGVDSDEADTEACVSYTCVANGGVSQTDDTLSILLDGSSTVEFDKTVVSIGEEFEMTVGCHTPSFKDIYVGLTYVDVNGTKTKIKTINVEAIRGFDSIGSNAIFLKPAGVTQMVIVGQGGIGENSIFTGPGVNIEFLGVQAGSEQLPPPEDHLLTNLPPEATSFTVETAINTTMDITW